MSVQFITSFVTAEGEEGRAHTLSSLVWRRSADGWRIICDSAWNSDPL